MATHSVLLPGKSHGQRSLVGCSPWGLQESDTTERLHFHFSLSCIREGNGSPLQCSCLENPKDGGAWWAAVFGVAQSRTQLKRLSRSIFYLSVHQKQFFFSPLGLFASAPNNFVFSFGTDSWVLDLRNDNFQGRNFAGPRCARTGLGGQCGLLRGLSFS